MTPAILLACAAAAVFSVATSLQQRAASAVPQSSASAPGLLARLVRQPSWLLGIGLSGVAFCLHAAALRQGSLTLVQPVVVSAIVVSVFVRAALDRRLPARKEVGWAVCTWAGLALFISVVGSSAAQRAANDGSAQMFFIGGVTVTAAFVRWAQKTETAARRGVLLGGAAGVLFGLIAGLIKVVLAQADISLLAVLGHWSLWAMLASGAGALLLNQRAYQAARLSVTMPVLNIVDVLVALAFGSAVFGDPLASSLTRLIAEVVGLAAMAIGVWQLARQQELSTSPGPAQPGHTPATTVTSTSPNRP